MEPPTTENVIHQIKPNTIPHRMWPGQDNLDGIVWDEEIKQIEEEEDKQTSLGFDLDPTA